MQNSYRVFYLLCLLALSANIDNATACEVSDSSPSMIDPKLKLEDYPKIVDKRDVGAYHLIIRKRPKPADYECESFRCTTLEIRKDEADGTQKLLYWKSENFAHFTEDFKQDVDMNGDGVPIIVVRTFSGGASCCVEYMIIELGDPIVFLGRFDFNRYDLVPFNLRLCESNLLLDVPDTTFTNWYPSMAESRPYIATIVVNASGQHLAMEHLQKKTININTLMETITGVWDEKNSYKVTSPKDSAMIPTPPELFENMQQLCYTGNGYVAWELLDKVWPDGQPGKEKYRQLFKDELKKSKYWDDICRMNKWEK